MTVAPVVKDNPVAGLHVYVLAPDAVNDTLLPLQISAGVGTVIVGREIKVAVTAVLVADTQPVVVFLDWA
jgi:hypothetical protein